VRLLVGDEDKLLPLVAKYSRLLDSLGIAHQFVVAPGAQHRYDEIFQRLPFDALTFWKTVFAQSH
jgi:acetyl esterase/lipase